METKDLALLGTVYIFIFRLGLHYFLRTRFRAFKYVVPLSGLYSHYPTSLFTLYLHILDQMPLPQKGFWQLPYSDVALRASGTCILQ